MTTHFGHLVRRLREERGLTQERAAVAAEMDRASWYRQERSARLIWRRSAATRAFVALHGAARVDAPSAELFMRATGLVLDAQSPPKSPAANAAATAAEPLRIPLRLLRVLHDMLAELGPERSTRAIEGAAIGAGVALPSIAPDDVRMLRYEPPLQPSDEYRIATFSGTARPAA